MRLSTNTLDLATLDRREARAWDRASAAYLRLWESGWTDERARTWAGAWRDMGSALAAFSDAVRERRRYGEPKIESAWDGHQPCGPERKS